jgi:antitoxin ParD1/3/4
MATMNISLPDKMKEWVESRAASGSYSNASDYVRDLIRKDRESSAHRERIAAEIEKGYASGFAEATVDEVLTDMIAEVDAVSPAKKSA